MFPPLTDWPLGIVLGLLVLVRGAIADRVSALPVLDNRSEDEILGYNEQGVLE